MKTGTFPGDKSNIARENIARQFRNILLTTYCALTKRLAILFTILRMNRDEAFTFVSRITTFSRILISVHEVETFFSRARKESKKN